MNRMMAAADAPLTILLTAETDTVARAEQPASEADSATLEEEAVEETVLIAIRTTAAIVMDTAVIRLTPIALMIACAPAAVAMVAAAADARLTILLIAETDTVARAEQPASEVDSVNRAAAAVVAAVPVQMIIRSTVTTDTAVRAEQPAPMTDNARAAETLAAAAAAAAAATTLVMSMELRSG